MDIIPATAPKRLTSDTKCSNELSIVDAYSKTPKLYGAETITTEEVIDKLYMFQSRFGKIDKFIWWDLEIILADAGAQLTLTEFKEEFQTCRVHLPLEAPEHQELNRQVKVKCITLRTISHSLMVHARFCKRIFILH